MATSCYRLKPHQKRPNNQNRNRNIEPIKAFDYFDLFDGFKTFLIN